MFTASIKSETLNLEKQVRDINVDFSDGNNLFSKKYSFPTTTSVKDIKKRIKFELDSYNKNVTPLSVGSIDFSDIAESEEEKARNDWFRDFNRLEQVQRLIMLDLLTGSENPVLNLKDKVKVNFKSAYIDYM